MKKYGALLLAAAMLFGAFSSPLSAAPAASSSSSSSSSASGASSDAKASSAGASSGASASANSKDPGSVSQPLPDSNAVSPTLPPPSFAAELQSKNIYMLNLDSNTPVYAKGEQERIYPASLAKIMTCILALEMVEDIDNETATLKPYIQNFLYTNNVNTLGGIYPDEAFCIRDLLYAFMLQSANEAAMMVADYVADGDMDYFCELMNKKAKEIGAKNTNFSNATGLFDENSYSTAYDLALIAQYAMQNEDFVEIVTTNAYTSNPTTRHPEGVTWFTRNYMQMTSREEYYAGLRGVKTGSLPEQNIHNFISTATRDGYSYLLVVCGAPIYRPSDQAEYENNLAFIDTEKLYEWAFKTFEVKTLLTIGKEVSEINVRLSMDVNHIKLVAADKFASLVPKETTTDSITYAFEYRNVQMLPVKGKKGETQPFIDAPVEKGQEIGYVKLMLAGEEVGRVRLVAGAKAERSDWLYYVDKAKQFFSTFVFKFVLIFVVIVILLYIGLMLVRNHNRRRYKMRRRPPPAAKRPSAKRPPNSRKPK